MSASLLGVFLFGEHIRTGAADLASEALALAVVLAGAAALGRSSLIADQDGHPSREHQPAHSGAASPPWPARPSAHPSDPPGTGSGRIRRPLALSPDLADRADRTAPGPAPAAAAWAGPPRSAREDQDLDPGRAAA